VESHIGGLTTPTDLILQDRFHMKETGESTQIRTVIKTLQLIKLCHYQLQTSTSVARASDNGHKKGYWEGHRQGYQKGVVEYKITYPCSACVEELVMMPDNKDHVVMKTMMVNGGWGHSSCHEAKKRR